MSAITRRGAVGGHLHLFGSRRRDAVAGLAEHRQGRVVQFPLVRIAGGRSHGADDTGREVHHRAVRHGGIFDRHQFAQRPARDHHPLHAGPAHAGREAPGVAALGGREVGLRGHEDGRGTGERLHGRHVGHHGRAQGGEDRAELLDVAEHLGLGRVVARLGDDFHVSLILKQDAQLIVPVERFQYIAKGPVKGRLHADPKSGVGMEE